MPRPEPAKARRTARAANKRIGRESVVSSLRPLPEGRKTENAHLSLPIPTPTFDRTFALQMLIASEAAYDLTKIPGGWKLAGTIEPGTFGFVATKGDDVLISFRGTENEREWLEDFDGLIVPNLYGPGHVHQGFQLQYTALRKGLLALMRWRPAGKIYITGHSLGAAMAVFAAWDLTGQFQCAPRVYTFAGPRVGLRSFSDPFDQRIPDCFRTCNVWDVVPHQWNQILGYSHVGHGVLVYGSFTLDLHLAHSLSESYGPGLLKMRDPAVLKVG